MPRKKKEPQYMGRACDFTGSDGVKRRVALHRGPECKIHIGWETWWEGEGKEPFRTEVILSLPALNATMSLLAELQAHPELFQVPVKK
jgi:hypothetical protein